MITRQQIRAVQADGARVVDSAGHLVGRVVNVILGARTFEPAYMTVACDLGSGIEVVVPLARARLFDGSVQLPYTAADVCGAPRAEASAGLSDRRQAEELRRYYPALDDGAPVWPQRLPDPSTVVAPVPPPAWPTTPVVAARNGHRRTNGASLASRPLDAGLDVLPVLPVLDVRTGNDSPTAYPATPSGPWPPVSTSSPGPPWWHCHQWRWPSVLTSVRAMRLELRPVLGMTGLPDDEREDLILAAGEAASNAVEHAGFSTLPFFDVLAKVGEDRARIVIQDHGRWRTPTAGGHRGRGLQMIGVLADATLTVGAWGTTVVLCNRPRSSR
jgi:anti-sigma regulatory factor (Ser/Thr protein kinase)